MKKLFRYFKYKSKRFIFKFLKFVLPIIFSLTIVLSSTLPAYATEWKGNGIILDIYSSYFWDTKNGMHKVTPIVDYTSNRAKVSFQTRNGYAYNDSHLYIFCDTKDILSVYGYFHLQIVGAQQTLKFDESTGIYALTYNERGESTIGDKLIDFNQIDGSNISMYVTSQYPLPDKFIIYVNYTHAYDFEVEVRAFDLSYTTGYPVYDDGKHNKEILDKEDEILVNSYNDFDESFKFGTGLYLSNEMLSGLQFASAFMNKTINSIPNIGNILHFSLILGIFGLIFGVLGSVVSFSTRVNNRNDKNTKGKKGG